MGNKKTITHKKRTKVEREALVRLKCHRYCRRKIMSLVQREALFLAQKNKEIGGVSASSIANEDMIRLRASQNEYNEALLASKYIEIKGKYISLLEFIGDAKKKSSELYVTTKGLETLAKERSFKWAFLTMTAPGYLHANPTVGRSQSRWTREKMSKAHEDLMQRWSRLGKKFSKDGYSMSAGDIFGFRVVEPHKDGTPHWHMLVFFPQELENYLFNEASGLFIYCFKHSESALKVIFGQDEKSTASSYALKYIMKSIGISLADKKNVSVFERKLIAIQAWKSGANIKSYQMFGVNGNSTVWNVARKISRKLDMCKFDFSEINQIHYKEYPSEDEMFNDKIEQYDYYYSTLSEEEKYMLENNNFIDMDNIETFNWKDNLSKELVYHIELNGMLSDYEMYEKERKSKEIIFHAVNNDYASFVNELSNSNLELLKENYIDRYGSVKKRVFGVNIGSQVIFIDRYKIITVENSNKSN
ncbi:TPA: replication endonuclease [Vibrio parahaemolyticus]|nr:replication endonuclease [Vibrio parahaemolyticus]